MLDIAWPELMVIGIVAVVAIGPKDLPKVMNMMGKWVGKARMMAEDVRHSIEQLNYEAEVADRMKQEAADFVITPAAAHEATHKSHHGHAHTAPVSTKTDPHDHLGST